MPSIQALVFVCVPLAFIAGGVAELVTVGTYATRDVPDFRAYRSDAACRAATLALPARIEADSQTQCTAMRAELGWTRADTYGRGMPVLDADVEFANGARAIEKFSDVHALDGVPGGSTIVVRRLAGRTIAVGAGSLAVATLDAPPHRIANDIAGVAGGAFLIAWGSFAAMLFRRLWMMVRAKRSAGQDSPLANGQQ